MRKLTFTAVARTVLTGAMVAGTLAMPAYGQSTCTLGRGGYYYGNDEAALAVAAFGLVLGMVAAEASRDYAEPSQAQATPRGIYYHPEPDRIYYRPDPSQSSGNAGYDDRSTDYSTSPDAAYGHISPEPAAYSQINPEAAAYSRISPEAAANVARYVGNDSHQQRCAQRYKSYDPYTDTFLARDGQRYHCQL